MSQQAPVQRRTACSPETDNPGEMGANLPRIKLFSNA